MTGNLRPFRRHSRILSRLLEPAAAGRLGVLCLAACLAGGTAWAGIPTAALDDLPRLTVDQPVIFSVTGDAPYGDDEIPVFQQNLDDHNSYSPSKFFVHVGDIISGSTPCDEYRYVQMADMLKTLAVPAYIIPGDNETTDCSDPAQAWIYWTRHLLGIEDFFCGTPPTQRQSGRTENFAFTLNGVLFMGINLVSSGNSNALMQDDADWFAQQIQTHGSSVRAAVLFSQSGPGGSRDFFFDQFAPTAGAWGKPVLLIHGDGHSWIHDQPFPQSNIVRVQVDRGDKPPLQVTVNMDLQDPWEFVRDPWPNGTAVLNRPPCVDAGPDLQLQGPGTVTLEGGASDDGDPNGTLTLQWSQVSGPASVGFGSPTAATTTASFSVTGDYVLRLTANDGALQTSDDVLVSVGLVSNEPPVALDDTYATDEDVTLSVAAPGLLANDDDPDGDALAASVSVLPQHGNLSLAANGGFSYTPSPDYFGPDSFVYQIDDGRGGLDQATVTLSVAAVNDAPLAADDAYETPAATPLQVAAPGVLDNDSDVEGDPLVVKLTQATLHGSVVLSADGSFTYVPDPDFAGYDVFQYQVSDASTAGGVATVKLAVGLQTFKSVADATVRANQSRKNFGSDASLDVKEGPKPYHAYLRFQLDSIETIRFATLRLYVNGSADPGELFETSNTYEGSSEPWLENVITWENAPALSGALVGSWNSAGDGTWIELDVTACIQSDGVYNFGLRTDSNSGASYSSREGDHPPELIVASAPRRVKVPPPQEFAEANPRKVGTAAARNALLGVIPEAGSAGFRLDYELATAAAVRIELFDVRGRRVGLLHDTMQSPGRHHLDWDGRGDAGRAAAAGIYFLRLQIGNESWTRKLLVAR